MPSLHMLGHMVAVAVIATLVKQILEQSKEVQRLQTEIDSLRKNSLCFAAKRNNVDLETEPPKLIKTTTTDLKTEDKNNVNDYMSESPNENIEQVNFSSEDNNYKNFVSASENHSLYKTEGIRSNKGDTDQDSVTSSVWCHDGENQMCQVKNICYNSDVNDFVVFLDDSSLLENVAIVDGSITIETSSLREHNNRQLTVSSLPSSVSKVLSVDWVNDTTLLFQRFLPSNVMHMFHDDIIPLHHTLRVIKYGSEQKAFSTYDVNIFLYEDFNAEDDSDINQFYAIFSNRKIMFKDDFQAKSRMTCFRDMYIGLMKTTVWYDYGFTKPQGPVSNIKVTSRHIRDTAMFIRHRLTNIAVAPSASDYTIVFNRKENRKILNAPDLTLGIVRSAGLKVLNLDLETYSLLDIILYIYNSKGIIGMHGSLMILAIFLQPGAFMIELFPYAVNPEMYTPYKTLCNINGMNIKYQAWVNQKPELSVGHPDWPAENGGLMHLSEEQREIIIKQTEVPAHLCCSDPSWLYHIYQDTTVNCEDIISMVKKLHQTENTRKLDNGVNKNDTFSPSKVRGVSCVKTCDTDQGKASKCHLNIHWNVPWTLQYVRYSTVHYQVLFQDMTADSQHDTVTRTSNVDNLLVSLNAEDDGSNAMFYTWVRAVIGENNSGPYSDAVLCRHESK